MRRYTCAVENCGHVTHIDYECFFCDIRYCREHDTDAHHSCYGQPAETVRKAKKERIDNVKMELALATKQKIAKDFPGYIVAIPPVDEILASGCNIHLPVRDTEGKKWLHESSTQTAAATMKFLEPANALVPRVRLPPHFKEYYLIEFMQGSPSDNSLDITNLDQDQRKELFRDFAKHFIALASVHTQGIGSLRYDPATDKYTIGSMTAQNPSLAEPPYFLGPFQTNLEEYMARINDALKCLEQESTVTSEVIARYLVQLELRRVISTCSELRKVEDEHFVLHGESVGSQFLLQDGRLTAVLDWDWTCVTTKAEAFAGSLLFFDNQQFFIQGSNALSTAEQLLVEAYVELGRDDLADCVRNGKKYQRIWTMIGGSPTLPEINGLQDAFGVEVDPQETLDEWLQMAAGRYEGNQGLMRLNERFMGE